ncbi:WXG100 family type VII secretion target [Microbacterium horticulturae]|uniref:ESAT-6-like protein n=1 Tax=Microbacterium horticulturae TaxID=3028316 RepID=A0ABY8BVX3_9MICO|nr:WXG100 family type VII secretion target [Microbacterium sp. KACC 23027]WEG08336.1 WXG100 family type VII secretion target [Microbacterium sp. KACC 23027]
MSDRITIDFTQVADAADQLSSAASRIDGILTTLDQKLDGLETEWTGAAFESYRRMRQDWCTHMAALQARLASYAKVLETSGSAMHKTESTLAKSF